MEMEIDSVARIGQTDSVVRIRANRQRCKDTGKLTALLGYGQTDSVARIRTN
jgi:hypothetical protein